jgi:hypothetical protein
MKRALVPVSILAALVFVISGCSFFGGTATVKGALQGTYFSIVSDVQVTFTRGDTTFTVAVPVSSSYDQRGAFVIANIPTGDYIVSMRFDASSSGTATPDGTTYSVDGGAWVAVDTEMVTGSAPPYAHTMTIHTLSLDGDSVLDIYFGDVE